MKRLAITSINDLMKEKGNLLTGALFVLDPGDHQNIRMCSAQGMSLILPNVLFSPSLVMQTIRQLNHTMIIISSKIWQHFEGVMDQNIVQDNLSIIILEK